MCTYLDCSTATDLFATRAEWLAHEKEFHLRAWKCRDHPSTTHESQKKFEDHLKSQHTSMTSREIEASVKYSVTNLADTRAQCCMCLVAVSQLPRGQSLANHMAHRFETFARPSLPDRGGEDDDMESEDSESTSAGGQEPALVQDVDVDIPKVTPEDFEDAAHPGEDMSIHALAVDGNKHRMRVLLEQQIDVNARDDEGWTALHRAAYGGQSTISLMLLNAGANVNYSSGYYGNALQCAALQGHEELVRLLLEGGANVNQQGGYHGTALLAATCQGHETTVEILLEAGAIVDVPNDRHASAINGAMHHRHAKLAQKLELKAESQRAPQDSLESLRTPHSDPLDTHDTQPPWQHNLALGGDFIYRPRSDEIILKTGRTFVRPRNISVESLHHAIYEGPLPMQYSENRRMRTIPQGSVEVVFQSPTPSQIARHEPARQPDSHGRTVSLGNMHVVSSPFPAFKVPKNAKQYFHVGRIFSVLWSESAETGSVVTRWEPGIVLNHLGNRVFSKVRRFVVIREGSNYCHALPITTYSGRGVSKPGVVKSEHVIIYSSQPAAQPQQDELPKRGEAGMRPVPIQVTLDSPSEVLEPMSRLNLGGVTMVQHNTKVQSFGKVCEASINDLQRQYEDVWKRDLAIPQIAAGPPIEEDSDDSGDDDGDDEDEEEQGSDRVRDDDEVKQQDNAKVTQPTDDSPESGAALSSMDEATQVTGSTTTMESVRPKGHPGQQLVVDRIANYRLTKEIIEAELLKMFPTMSSAALDIRVSGDVHFKITKIYADGMIGME